MYLKKLNHKKYLLLKSKQLFSMFFDGLGAFLLFLYALILGPLGALKGPIVIERAFWYIYVLAPLGLLVRGVRVGIDWRLGNFSLAISQGEAILVIVEEHRLKKQKSKTVKRVLIDLYTMLTRAYMHTGRIDEAMSTVMRAKENLGRDYLADLVGVDAKTAQLVRAGLSAGRLLEGEGLTTLFVKSKPKKTPKIKDNDENRSVITETSQESRPSNVIPFPQKILTIEI